MDELQAAINVRYSETLRDTDLQLVKLELKKEKQPASESDLPVVALLANKVSYYSPNSHLFEATLKPCKLHQEHNMCERHTRVVEYDLIDVTRELESYTNQMKCCEFMCTKEGIRIRSERILTSVL